MVRRIVILSLVFLAVQSELVAAQDMRRCQRADGSIVYTDRQCEPGQNEQAVAEIVASALPRYLGRSAITPPPSCSKTTGDLVHTVRTAIASHDVNLLARSYHWPGLSDAQVESVLTRLDILAQKPLVDIRLMYPEPANSPGIPLSDTDTDIDAAVAGSNPEPDQFVRNAASAPYALKLQQHATSESSEILGTRFGLLRHFNCWWIRY